MNATQLQSMIQLYEAQLKQLKAMGIQNKSIEGALEKARAQLLAITQTSSPLPVMITPPATDSGFNPLYVLPVAAAGAIGLFVYLKRRKAKQGLGCACY